MTAELRVNASVTVNGQQAVADLNKVEKAVDGVDKAQKKLKDTSGQLRAATANLGQQIGDISQGFAAGTSAATIFAQQGGQVAYAISGMGGVLGSVGTFLSGPFGAALTGAVIILGSLAASHDKAAESAEKQRNAGKTLEAAMKDLDAATGVANKSTTERIRLAALDVKAMLEQAKANRDLAQVELDGARLRLTKAQADERVGGAKGLNFGSSYVTSSADKAATDALKKLDKLQAKFDNDELAAAASANFGRAAAAAKALTDPLEAIRVKYDELRLATGKAGFSQEVMTKKLAELNREQKSAEDAVAASAKAAGAAQREHNKELRDGARDANRMAEALDRAVQAGARAVANANGLLGGVKGPTIGFKEAIDKQEEQARKNDTLSDMIKARDAALPEIGNRIADGFKDRALTDAIAIGQAIGGTAGRAIQTIFGLLKGAKTGDFTGVGGPLGGIATLVAGPDKTDADGRVFGRQVADGLKGYFADLGALFKSGLAKLGNIFGGISADLANRIGGALGGAATGQAVAGIGNALGIKLNTAGSTIGGALGGFIGGPIGSLLGSVAGGIIGGLFKKTKTGSSVISDVDTKGTTSGNNAQAISGASGLTGQVQQGLQSLAQALGGGVGNFGKLAVGSINGYYGVNLQGQTIGKKNSVGFGNTETSAAEAVAYAIQVAIERGAVTGLSPRVQAVLKQYGDDLNKAASEAIKVKGLEDLLSDRKNPFAATFRTLEATLKQRVDVASKYGFDLVEIERINGEDRAKAVKDTLAAATGNIKALLDDLQFGSRATGSATERLAGLTTERDRLTALAQAGDNGQLDAIASIVQQIDDLQKETFGKTAGFATGRADSVSLLNDLMKQAQDRVNAAADAARAGTETTNGKLTEANASLDDLVAGQAATNAQLAAIAASLAGGKGISFALSSEYAR